MNSEYELIAAQSSAENISSRVAAMQARHPDAATAFVRFSEGLYDRLLERMGWTDPCRRPQGPRLDKTGFQIGLAEGPPTPAGPHEETA